MIVVLEGLNGTGKSALARGLSPEFGPVVRAFRRTSRDHFSGDKLAELNALGIPANTYVEDAFIAEVLGQTSVEVILDRSMPSGVAYKYLEDKCWTKVHDLIWTWIRSFSGRRVAVVHLVADRKVRESRTKGRRFDGKEDLCVGVVLNQCVRWLDGVMGFHVLTYDTSEVAKDQALKDVKNWLESVRSL